MALVTILTFLIYNYYRIVIKLLFSTNIRGLGKYTLVKFSIPDLAKLDKKFFYYIVLSYNYNIIVLSLYRVFQKPNVLYNLVSPWLYLVINEVLIIEEIISFKGYYKEILTIIYTIYYSKLSTLQLEAIISRLALIVLNFVRSSTLSLDSNIFIQTSYIQLFIDLIGLGLYFQTKALGEKL